jgi:hypothetical protein
VPFSLFCRLVNSFPCFILFFALVNQDLFVVFRDVVDCCLFYWTYARKLHGHGHIDCVVCYKDALNVAKVCCAVNPQVRVLPGYRDFLMRLGYVRNTKTARVFRAVLHSCCH